MAEAGTVNETPESDESAVARAARELAQLQAQAEEARQQTQEARAALALVRRDLEEARKLLDSSQSVRLLEANEELVLAMLKAQADAETTALALQEATRSSELDAMTELPNRVRLLDRFAQAMATAKRHGGRLALLFLDLNNFKKINDTLGHAFGDELLKLVARRLAGSVREADTVCRHGGDEFVILLTEVTQASDAILIADKVMAALGAPSRVGDHVIRLTASIGVSIYPDDGEDAATLIDRADAAMYRAKRRGLGTLGFHGEAPTKGRIA
jgi:diguanylate cyclase (GGDEF)-like protein